MGADAAGEALVDPSAYVIDAGDTVATALEAIPVGPVGLRGARGDEVQALEAIPRGHKIALAAHAPGDAVIKYGVAIARATERIAPGAWVHLHCAESRFDERSAALDPITGAPTDTSYA